MRNRAVVATLLFLQVATGFRPSQLPSPISTRLYEAKNYVVVGGGWGGWGACKALAEAGQTVTLVDALPDPTGATPYRSTTGKPVEAGTRGFWKDYPNIQDLDRKSVV